MTEIEEKVDIFTKLDALRAEIQRILPELESDEAETQENTIQELIFLREQQEKRITDLLKIQKEQEQKIETLTREIYEKSEKSSLNFNNSAYLTPEKTESTGSGIVEDSWDFGEAGPNDKNWNSLSKKLKLKCIEFLDFHDRLPLRQTSKTERRLVESARFPVDEFLLFGNQNFLSLWRNDQCSFKIANFNQKRLQKGSKPAFLGILRYILTICDSQNMVVYDLPKVYESIFQGAQFPAIRVQNFYSKSLGDSAISLFKMGKESIQVVEFDAFDSKESHLQKITAASLARRMHFSNFNKKEGELTVLIKSWIYNNSDIGSELSVQQIGKMDLTLFFARFRKCTVREHGQWEREMCTSDPSKNVLIQINPSQSLIKCTVVHPRADGVLYV